VEGDNSKMGHFRPADDDSHFRPADDDSDSSYGSIVCVDTDFFVYGYLLKD